MVDQGGAGWQGGAFGIGYGNDKSKSQFLDWEWDYKLHFPVFGIENGCEKYNFQLLGLGKGTKNWSQHLEMANENLDSLY